MFRKYWLVGLLVGLMGIGGWQGPALAQAWQTNRMALAAMEVCTGQQGLSAMAEAPPFLQAGAARCVGEEVAEFVLYNQAISLSSDRLEIIRIQMPLNVDLAQEAASLYPDQEQAYFWLADVLEKCAKDTSQLFEAIKAYEMGLTLNPANSIEWTDLGRLYERVGNLDKAIKAFDFACHYGDVGGNGCFNAGRLYLQQAMYEEAADRFSHSLDQLPGFHPYLWGEVHALLGAKRLTEAMPYLETLAAQGDTEAQTQLEELQALP